MDELSPENPSEMVIPKFDGRIDAYWWVLCTEKYFKHLHTIVAGLAMKGPPLTWWLRWYPLHSSVNWDAFTSIFLWHFKPEWRVILPLPDDVDADFSTIVDDFGKSQHETCPEESVKVNSVTEENQTPMVYANASPVTEKIDEIQNQDDMQKQIGNKINCISSISFKPQPLSNSSPNSFHLSLSRERVGFSMTAATSVFYVGDDIPIDPKPPDRVVVRTLSLPLIKMMQPGSFNLGSLKERTPSSTVTLPWVEPPPPEPPDRHSCIVAANKSINHFQFNIFAATLEILKEDLHGSSNVKVILPMCNIVTDTLRFSILLNEFTRDRDLKYVPMLLEPIIQHEFHLLLVDMGEAWKLVIWNVIFLGYHRFKQNKDSIVLFWVYSAQKVFAEMPRQSIVSWLTFIEEFFTSTYGWEVYTSFLLDLCNTYVFYDGHECCIFYDLILMCSLIKCSQGCISKMPLNYEDNHQISFLKHSGLKIPTIASTLDLVWFHGHHLLVFSPKHQSKLIENVDLMQPLFFTKEAYVPSMSNTMPTFMKVTPWFIITSTLSLTTNKSPQLHLQLGVVVDHNECEKETLFNIGISSKPVVIFIYLEDKIIFRGDGNDMINVVLIPCLFTNMYYNEEIIYYVKVVEVELMERIRHKKMLLLSWSDVFEFYHVQIMDPLEVDSLNSHIFFTKYHEYSIGGKGTWWKIKAKNQLAHGQFENVYDWDINPCGVSFIIGIDINDPGQSLLLSYILLFMRIHATHSLKLGKFFEAYYWFAHMDQVNNGSELNVIFTNVLTMVGHATTCDLIPISCAHFEQWDPGQQLDMSTGGRSFKRKKWDPGRHGNMHTTTWSSKFKQWDPGIICARSDFYNLEDKVDFEGVGNVMILEAQISIKPKSTF